MSNGEVSKVGRYLTSRAQARTVQLKVSEILYSYS